MRKKVYQLLMVGLLSVGVIGAFPLTVHADDPVVTPATTEASEATEAGEDVSSSSLPTAEELGVDEETYEQMKKEWEHSKTLHVTESLDDPQQDETNICPVTFEITNVPDNFALINDNAAYMQIQSDKYTIRIPATANENYKHTCYVPEGEYTIQICAFLNDTRQTYPLEMPSEVTFTASVDKATTVSVKMDETAAADAEASIKATQIANEKAEEEAVTLASSSGETGNAAGRDYDPEVGPGDNEEVKSMSEINREYEATNLISENHAVKPWSKPVIILICVAAGVAVAAILVVRKIRKDNRE